MKKIVSVILALTLILALSGCKKTDNTSSESELSSEPIISSNEEDVASIEDNSSETTVVNSSEESKINSSSMTSSTNVNSNVNTTTENTNTSSQTTAKNEPSTYFEKYNLKITPISNELCFNDDPNHKCPYDKDISLQIKSIDQNSDYLFDTELFGENFDISSYNEVEYHCYAVNTYDWEECNMNRVITFDKYTGNIIGYGTLGEYGWQELNFNGKKIYVTMLNGQGAGGYVHSVICPKEYDGVVFAVFKNPSWSILSNQYKINEIVNLNNSEYYLFTAND